MNSTSLEVFKMELIIPKDYDPRLSIRETQDAIKYIRDTFQKEMGREMHLERISAPLFVEKSSGLNDNLNGTAVRFISLPPDFIFNSILPCFYLCVTPYFSIFPGDFLIFRPFPA